MTTPSRDDWRLRALALEAQLTAAKAEILALTAALAAVRDPHIAKTLAKEFGFSRGAMRSFLHRAKHSGFFHSARGSAHRL